MESHVSPDISRNLNANGPLRGRFAALEGLVAWLETEVNTLNEAQSAKITELQRELQKTNKDSLESEIATHKGNISRLTQVLSHKDTALKEALCQIDELESKCIALEETLNAHVKESESKTAPNDSQAKCQELELKCLTLEETIDALRIRYQSLIDDREKAIVTREKLLPNHSGINESDGAEVDSLLLIASLEAEISALKQERDAAITDLNEEILHIRAECENVVVALTAELEGVRMALTHPLAVAALKDSKPSSGNELGSVTTSVLERLSLRVNELSSCVTAGPPTFLTSFADLGLVHLSWQAPVGAPEVAQYLVLREVETGVDGVCKYSEWGSVPGSQNTVRVPCWDTTGTVRFRVCAVYAGDVWSAFTSPVVAQLPKRVQLKFLTPFDQGGVLYYIGTVGGSRDYSNPHVSGAVVASLSSAATDASYSQPHKFVGRTNDGYCCTDNRQGSYMCVDLGPQRRLHVTHYCLRNDGLGMYHVLRSWKLQGRVGEDDEWETLRRHEDDAALGNTAFATAVWDVTDGGVYRYFRILQFDVNSYGAHNIMCCGIELYGALYTTVPEEVAVVEDSADCR